jgi:hypothetical protein
VPSSFIEDVPSFPPGEPSSLIDSSPEQLVRRSHRLRRPPDCYGVFVSSFFHFCRLGFGRYKSWMAPKMRSWKHLFMSFPVSRFLGHLIFGSPES